MDCSHQNETDENLARSELTPAEESAYILSRKEIWEEINGKTLQNLEGLGGRGNKQFASEVSNVTGESVSGVRQKIARACELGQNINRIVGMTLDKGASPSEAEAWSRLSLSSAATPRIFRLQLTKLHHHHRGDMNKPSASVP